MVAFVSVLIEVERRSEEVQRPFTPLHVGFTEPLPPFEANARAARQVIAAYRRFQQEQPPAPAGRAVDDPFPELLSQARHSARDLKSLRRRLAWRLHPDRGAATDDTPSLSLSEINATIDAALARCSSSGRRE
ncbi:hypothetical protein [Methylocystis echinoides]|uniref:hypothetical protein n=1 Tax=Methylocystis echinoides TaxID=29468 RepID=UPI00342A80A6